jgi:nuclear transport factor 2 (NTF2) superfamily protein
VLGYADDALAVALVLRAVVRRAGPDVVRRRWPGTPGGLEVVGRLTGLDLAPVGRQPTMASPTDIRPPFDATTAAQKVQSAEDAWNTRDPERVALAYSEDSEWRNRDEFLRGRDEIKAFLARKWERELDYRLRKELWAFTDDHIAVRFEYASHDPSGQWWRSYGNEMWEFAPDGLMRKRFASINDVAIEESDRRL